MKKVLFVIESLHCGGAEKSLVSLLNYLPLTQMDVSLFILESGGEFEKLVPEQVPVSRIKKSKNKLLLTLCRLQFLIYRKLDSGKTHPAQLFWKAYGSLFKKIEQHFDLAIAYNQGFATYYVASKVTARKKLCWLNTDYSRAGYRIQRDKKYYEKYDQIVCVSGEVGNKFQLLLQQSQIRTPILIIPDLINADLIESLGQEAIHDYHNSGFKILTIARLAHAKGIDLAIEAARILKDKGLNFNWTIVGEGPDRNKLETLIKKNNLRGFFELIGFRENPYPYLEACELYVQPSRFEGLGITVIEAKILRKPILITNFSTSHYLVSPGNTGMICEASGSGLAKGIIQLADDPEKMTSFSGNLANWSHDNSESLAQLNTIFENEN
jgi:glycosyltransferase involved in cell wall biosynthesis